MNAAIRAVTRSAIYNGMSVKGIYRGYKGLITDEIEDFKTQNVSNIIQRGGTILKTARCAEFKTPEGRKQAYDKLMEHGIDALVAIGGDGTLTGARIFAQEFNYPIVGLPGTIDNDLYGTDITIGYDTALNTIMECVDKIRDTATSLKLELGKSIKRSPVIRAVAEAFETYYDIFLETCDMSRLKEDYNRELANTGREVLVLDPRGQYEGTALGIDDEGSLLVRKRDGTVAPVISGEVSVRGIYGYI